MTVYIGKSSIHGRGLFTKEEISKGQIVVYMTSPQPVTQEQIKIYPCDAYIHVPSQSQTALFDNAWKTDPPAWYFINHGRGKSVNVKLVWKNNTICWQATKKILPNQELFFDYDVGHKVTFSEEKGNKKMFDTSLLSGGRYVVIAEACLPLVGGAFMSWLLPIGPNAGRSVVGRPPAGVFGLVWLTIAVLWFFALLVASMNFDDTHLILVAVFSLLAMLMCGFWIYLYHNQMLLWANYTLFAVAFLSFMITFSSCNVVTSLDSYAPTLVTLCMVLMSVWTTLASIFSLIELQT